MTRPTALLLSPHLDDVAFSCGGLAALLADSGWRVVMATAFTRTIHPAHGFALACQLDKGLAPEVDYMDLRRHEDRAAAALLGVEARWLDLPEAPHRGYDSAPALFSGARADDTVWQDLAALLGPLLTELSPALVAVPQGLGRHVDHLQAIRAVLSVRDAADLLFYRDTPYIIRDPSAAPAPGVPVGPSATLDIAAALERKLAAACAYSSQVGFQFGGPGAARTALSALTAREGGERFIGRLPELAPIPISPVPQPGHHPDTI